MQKSFVADKSMHNRKIEYILSGTLGFSAGIIKKLKQAEGIMLNGEKVRLNHVVCEGDEILLIVPECGAKKIKPENIPLNILYEDEDILAVNKPPAMMTHPSREHYTGTLANGVVHYLNISSFYVVTRLDKDTSGVVIIAKNSLAAHKLNELMRQGKIFKEYIALVDGKPNDAGGVINMPIARGEGIRRVAAYEGKTAITHYFVEKELDSRSLVRLVPITGRTHQLRVHMQYIGHPICGDWLYGKAQKGERTMLHCRKIELCHPFTDKKITIEAPIPDDINKVIEKNIVI